MISSLVNFKIIKIKTTNMQNPTLDDAADDAGRMDKQTF